MPALFQVRNERDGQEFLVDLCILHLRTVPKAVGEMQALRHKEADLLSYEEEQREEKI